MPVNTKKKYTTIFIALIAVLIIAVAGVFLYLYLTLASKCIKSELTVEAGSNCPAIGEFLNRENDKAYFTSDITDETLLTELGDYEVSIYLYWHEMTATVHVVDTTAPSLETADVSIMHGDSVSAEDFVADIDDVTDTSVCFAEEPDLDYEGTQTVTVEAIDEGGNITLAEASLEIVFDREAPVISGVQELVVTEGDSVSYKKGVTVTDNIDENVQLTVDASSVDLETAGVYDIVYRAVDKAGNEATETAKIYVVAAASVSVQSEPEATVELTEEYIYALADETLASIITDGMSQYEQAKAIYWWCHDKIAYSDGASKDNWMVGAYQGLAKHRGDCYTYAMTAQVLLTRVGIANFTVERIRVGDSMHWWNVIDIGEGWHHFDTTRRADGSTFFYLTDAELMAYSDTHNGTHNYDKSLYPEIP